MSSTELEDAISTSRKILQGIFPKPKCSSKLLAKPPFRFIHDIVTSTLENTGFPDQYFSPPELDSTNLKDKESKLLFLEKLIRLVSVCVGFHIDTRPSKIVAGLEPINTNLLLAEFGRVASVDDFDHDAAVKYCLNDGKVGQFPRILTNENNQETTLMHTEKSTDARTDAKEGSSESKDEPDVDAENFNDLKHWADIKWQIEQCNSDVNRTQALLHDVISKPKCTEKLLRKPPFRFIHDVAMALNKATSLNLQEIFSEAEMDSSKARDKETKITFLDKLLCHVEKVLVLTIDLKPSKVIAGLEVDKTRHFFQLLILAARFGTFDQQNTASAKSPLDDIPVVECKEREGITPTTLAHGNDAVTIFESSAKQNLQLEPSQDGIIKELTNAVSEARQGSMEVEILKINDNQTTTSEQVAQNIPLAKEGLNYERSSRPEAKQQSINTLFFDSNKDDCQEIGVEISLTSARPKTALLRRPSSVRESEEDLLSKTIIYQARPFVMKASKAVEELSSSDGESDDEDAENIGSRDELSPSDDAPKLKFHLHFQHKQHKSNEKPSTNRVKRIPYNLNALAEAIQNLARSAAPVAKALESLPKELVKVSEQRKQWSIEYNQYAKERSKVLLNPLEEEMLRIEKEADILRMSIKESTAQIHRNDFMIGVCCGKSSA